VFSWKKDSSVPIGWSLRHFVNSLRALRALPGLETPLIAKKTARNGHAATISQFFSLYVTLNDLNTCIFVQPIYYTTSNF